MTKFLNKKIYITGATGWVGKTIMHELQGVIPENEFNRVVIAFGSHNRMIESTNYGKGKNIKIPIRALTSLRDEPSNQNILLIHGAFLTKDKINHWQERIHR